jgi:hypothetical protein
MLSFKSFDKLSKFCLKEKPFIENHAVLPDDEMLALSIANLQSPQDSQSDFTSRTVWSQETG